MSGTEQTEVMRDARGRAIWQNRTSDIAPPRLEHPSYRWPAPWPGVHIDWYYDAREKLAPVAAATQDLQNLLSEHRGSFWTANLADVIAGEHRMHASVVRREMVRMWRDGRACLVEQGQVWCSPELVDGWPALKEAAWRLLSDTSTPPLATFAEIATALNCTEASAHAVTWIACEWDHDIFERYAQHFLAERAPQPAA